MSNTYRRKSQDMRWGKVWHIKRLLTVGTYSEGNLLVVYEISRQVFPTAPSPTTTHLMVCIKRADDVAHALLHDYAVERRLVIVVVVVTPAI